MLPPVEKRMMSRGSVVTRVFAVPTAVDAMLSIFSFLHSYMPTLLFSSLQCYFFHHPPHTDRCS